MYNMQSIQKLVGSLRPACLQCRKGYIQFIPNMSTESLFYVRRYGCDCGLDSQENNPTVKEKNTRIFTKHSIASETDCAKQNKVI